MRFAAVIITESALTIIIRGDAHLLIMRNIMVLEFVTMPLIGQNRCFVRSPGYKQHPFTGNVGSD